MYQPAMATPTPSCTIFSPNKYCISINSINQRSRTGNNTEAKQASSKAEQEPTSTGSSS
jgi:hypothetical protein